MRRGLAALLFFIAAVCLALAAGGWWLQRVAFEPDISGDVVNVAMDNAPIRGEVARTIANASAATVGVPPLDLRIQIERFLEADNPEIQATLASLLAQTQGRLTGARDEPVQLTGPQLVPIVRDERVATMPPVTLPVERITALNVIRIGLRWFVPVAAIAGAVALLLGLVAHPRRSDAVFGIGMFCLFAAAAVVILGYLLPTFVAPELSDVVWLEIMPAIARTTLPIILATAAGLLVAAFALMMVSSAIDRRRRSWDKPIGVHRQPDQRRWS